MLCALLISKQDEDTSLYIQVFVPLIVQLLQKSVSDLALDSPCSS